MFKPWLYLLALILSMYETWAFLSDFYCSALVNYFLCLSQAYEAPTKGFETTPCIYHGTIA